ncbi:MAG: hypothetical protein A2655_02705 [Candidatus Yanofskybacteria bacterium RIFCSPHIGHO2_01_FULL_43_42]|uniref:Uncharacterized protein n=1 Tax=Candidatus Yanofskybacteria bacterium RIFCSPLOWO2_01_FULL_43_22 TaxID=1802695 RepID=A0A1F8GJQ8_9BACT|nr:MAG: hypothetical protein A2655_02705 [Candidatus Yanofskybacteria bacterium RIFCSPHIGHO2_01_FULL_43_42]OGN24948.1 MAG: hypothetical protein A3A13_01495 [Candidatus Yanofskybacteria bacterium RIFCSPLOWO2_01_FULL_43_22]
MFWSIQILDNYMLGIRLISNDEFAIITIAGKSTRHEKQVNGFLYMLRRIEMKMMPAIVNVN